MLNVRCAVVFVQSFSSENVRCTAKRRKHIFVFSHVAPLSNNSIRLFHLAAYTKRRPQADQAGNIRLSEMGSWLENKCNEQIQATLGLEYVIGSKDNNRSFFSCVLCKSKIQYNPRNIVPHTTDNSHRLEYLVSSDFIMFRLVCYLISDSDSMPSLITLLKIIFAKSRIFNLLQLHSLNAYVLSKPNVLVVFLVLRKITH